MIKNSPARYSTIYTLNREYEGYSALLVCDKSNNEIYKPFKNFLRILTGKTIPLDIKASDTNESVKLKIQN